MNPHMVPYGYQDELRLRLEKLSRAYDLTTMKIFMAVESLGDNNVYSTYSPVGAAAANNPEPPINSRLVSVWHHDQKLHRQLDKLADDYDTDTMRVYMTTLALGQDNLTSVYDPSVERKELWESFLIRKEACRLDLTRHEKTREKYEHFLTQIGREEQGKQFFHAMITLLKSKGAVDIFRHIHPKQHIDLESTFCGHLCRLFDQKIGTWFDSFEAVNVRLTAHVKVANLVRVLSGQVDLLCRKAGVLHAVNIKVTGMPTPRPMDVNELCLVKCMVIQNGLAHPDAVSCCLLVCHLGEDRPVLRLWEYRPTRAMDAAIREADIDNMIEAGKLSKLHEMWPQNVLPPGVASLTARLAAAAADDDVGGPAVAAVPAKQAKVIDHGVGKGDVNRKTPSIVKTTT